MDDLRFLSTYQAPTYQQDEVFEDILALKMKIECFW